MSGKVPIVVNRCYTSSEGEAGRIVELFYISMARTVCSHNVYPVL